MSDSRKNKRYACTVPVEGKEKSVFDHTQVIDFSKGGIGFVSQHRIPVNKEVPIEIDLTADGEQKTNINQARTSQLTGAGITQSIADAIVQRRNSQGTGQVARLSEEVLPEGREVLAAGVA